MREAEHRGPGAAEHGRGNLEARRIQRETGAERLDQRFLQAPEPVEHVRLARPRRRGEGAPFGRAVDAAADTVEVPARGAFLQVHSQPVVFGEPDQAVRPAVAQVEADRRGRPVHLREGLAVLEVTEGEIVVRAPEPLAQVDPQRRPAEREPAPGSRHHETVRAASFLVIEERPGPLLPALVGTEVHMQDERAVGLAPGAPPRVTVRRHRETALAGASVTSRR